jgi:hypothetical protein
MCSQEAIRQAIQAVQSGDKEVGRRLLAQVLRADPTDIEAWLWMSEAVDSDEQKRDCLRRVLSLDPENQAAQSRIATLLTPAPSTEPDEWATPRRSGDYGRRSIGPKSRTVAKPGPTPAQRTRGYRNTMLAGAQLLLLLCGLALLIYTVTTIVPQAREKIKPTPEMVLYTATLWCPPCEQAGSPVVLWERVGDGVSRGSKTGELPHDTAVSVLAEEWSEPEERVYFRVTAQGQTGWVPQTFIQK